MTCEMNHNQFRNSEHILMTNKSLSFLLSTIINEHNKTHLSTFYFETVFFSSFNVNVAVFKVLLINFCCLNVLLAIKKMFSFFNN